MAVISSSLEVYLRTISDDSGVENFRKQIRMVGVDLNEMSKGLKDALSVGEGKDEAKVLQALYEQSQAYAGVADQAQRLADVLKGLGQHASADKVSQLAQTLREAGQSALTASANTQVLREEFRGAKADTRVYADQIRNLRVEAQEYHQIAQRMFSEGDKRAGIMKAQGDALANEAKAWDNLDAEVDNAHIGKRALDSFIKSDFLKTLNRLGFAIFITKASISTLTQLVEGLFNAMAASARARDSMVGFTALAKNMGVEATNLRARMKDLSEGLLSTEEAMAGATRLFVAGAPQIANQAGELARAAVNVAKFTGQLENAGKIYNTMLTGIIKRQPLLIDNAEIYLKLAGTFEKYAASIGKTRDELTQEDEWDALTQEILRQSDAISSLGEQTDFTADTFARIKNDMKDTRQVFAVLSGVMAEGFADTIDEAAGVRDSILAWVAAQKAGSRETAEFNAELDKLNRSFGSISGFIATAITGIMGLFGAVGGGIAWYGLKLDELYGKVNNLNSALGENLERLTMLSPTWGALITQLRGVGRENEAVAKAFDENTTGFDAMREGAEAAVTEFGQLFGLIDTGVESVNNLNTELAKMSFGDIQKQVRQNLEDAMEDLAGQANERRLEAEEEFNNEVEETYNKHTSTMLSIQEDFNKKREKLENDWNEKQDKIWDSYNDKLDDLGRTLFRKYEDIQNDANDARFDAQLDYNKASAKLEEDYQKDLVKIRQKYDLDALKAIIDRDARALFEAQQNRDEDLVNAQENADKKRREEEQAYRDELAAIDRQEGRKYRDANKRDAEARQDAEIKRERALNDLSDWYARQEEVTQTWYDEKREEEKKRYDEELAEMITALDEKMGEIQEWYDEERNERERRRAMARIQEGIENAQDLEQLRAFLNDRKILIEEHFGSVQQLVSGTGMNMGSVETGGVDPNAPAWWNEIAEGGGTDTTGIAGDSYVPGSGTGGSRGSAPPRPVAGAACSALPSRGYVGDDGQTYFCRNGVWVSGSDIGILGLGQASSTSSSAPSGTQSQVTILTSNDDTLSTILQDVTTDVIISTIGGN